MPAKLTITLKRLLFVLAVALFLPACYAESGYYRAGYYAPAYRTHYREGYYYRAPPPRTVVVVPRGHGYREDRRYYRAPASRYHYDRRHDDRRRHY